MGGQTIDRRESRILAMQALAQLEVHGNDYQQELDSFLDEADVTGRTRRYARELITQAWSGRPDFDKTMKAIVQNWAPGRMAAPERNILRVAAVELEAGSVPPRVIISEAVAIAEAYGSGESARFVNGVLDKLWKSRSENKE